MSEAYHCYRWKIGASSLSDGGITSLSHCSVEGSALSSRDLKPFLEDAMGPLPYRQDERQYNQPGQQRARDKRKRYLQWVRMEIAAPLC